MVPTTPVLIIADDLTGAGAAGAGVAALGLRTLIVGREAQQQDFSVDGPVDALVIDTGSRHATPDQAVKWVRAAVDQVSAPAVVSKRIDTTLRGNIGVEVLAALEQLEARDGSTWRALVCAAYPAAGRVTRNGMQYVDGVAVAESPAGRDRRDPVRFSRIADQFSDPVRPITHVDAAQVDRGGADLEEVLGAAQGIVICDAETDKQVRALARAVFALTRRDDGRWLAVDPGPLTVGLVENLIDDGRTLAPVFVMAASVTAATHRQLDQLEVARGARLLQVDPGNVEVRCLTAMLSDVLATGASGPVGLRVVPSGSVELDTAGAERLTTSLAGVLAEVARLHPIGGFYLTGGDTAAAVVAALGAHAIDVQDEVLPLAVCGRLVGGSFDGLELVTKGGGIGDDGAAVACVDALVRRQRRARFLTSLN